MGIVYGHQCRKLLTRAKNKEEACRLATIHMAGTPHILVFGYTDQEAKKQGLIKEATA